MPKTLIQVFGCIVGAALCLATRPAAAQDPEILASRQFRAEISGSRIVATQGVDESFQRISVDIWGSLRDPDRFRSLTAQLDDDPEQEFLVISRNEGSGAYYRLQIVASRPSGILTWSYASCGFPIVEPPRVALGECATGSGASGTTVPDFRWFGLTDMGLVPGTQDDGRCELPASLAAAIPDTVPTPGLYATIRDQGVPFAELDLGIGHLRPTDETWAWDWLSTIVLPLSDAPGAAPFGWIARGWAIGVETASVEPFRVSGMVETGYEEPTFIVLNQTSEDWIEIRVSPTGTMTETGTAWIPACAFDGDPVDLTVEPWEDRLLSDLISPLYFRTGVPHVLRDAPGADGARLGVIAGSYHLEPQEIAGDWMRVIVKQPSDYCVLESRSVARTGWVKWRSDEVGPWVWYYTRGC